MSEGVVHIIGAGLAGLGAAVAISAQGRQVVVHESAAHAGGRCRSYHDPLLDRVIDNGNHLVLSGNRAVMRYLCATGAADTLTGPVAASYDFYDVGSGERWTVTANEGALPWWILDPARRVPGTRARDYLGLARLFVGNDGDVIAARVRPQGRLWSHLIDPVLVAALNTSVAEASAPLAAAVLRESLARGGRASQPRIAATTLAATFVDPALATLNRRGVRVRFNARLHGIAMTDDRASALDFADGPVGLGPADQVVVAVPAGVATDLLPGLSAPDQFRAIVNGHFAMAPPPGAPAMLGLIGGTAEWLFAFGDRLSVTVSDANRLLDQDRATLAARFWADICAALAIDAPMPPWQIVKEKRATFAATPDQDARRPGTATRWRNLALAGDWTRTGLPATIEGALRSGEAAAAHVMARS
ncbi:MULTISPECIES: hydroxysqualene dehydroxylase HpnE [unclassified Sphingomonas]|jgi:squalene-associated FAD-dependent desaturase|uniref:hydroxysqualene dehydroxylase HpnE n=1 Tax=unclassified Sphingomonas TaxID=196159 RepID=UPI00082F8D16|nr:MULTISPECIES: hydroxysqualene dehydroxylase HpnE [unclassified Sphingomonas]